MANITFARNPGLLGCTPELMGGAIFDEAAHALPYSGSVSDNTRSKISRLIRELLNMEVFVETTDFTQARELYFRLEQIKGYFEGLGAAANPRRDLVLKGINTLYNKIGAVWAANVLQQANAFQLDVAASTSLPYVKGKINDFENYIVAEKSKLPGPIAQTASVQAAISQLEELNGLMWGHLNYLNEKAAGGSTSVEQTSRKGLTDRGTGPVSFNWGDENDEDDEDDDKKEEEGMGLALPLALAAGGVGLFLALRG